MPSKSPNNNNFLTILVGVIITICFILYAATSSNPGEETHVTPSSIKLSPATDAPINDRHESPIQGIKNTNNKNNHVVNKLKKCFSAKHSPISKAASEASFSNRLQHLCKSSCKISDKPDFCSSSNNNIPSSPRFDHGCYEPIKEDYNSENMLVQQQQHEEVCDNEDSVTAIFTAISNSSVGARFYGSCQEYAWESIRQWRLFHPMQNGGDNTNCNRVFFIVSDELFNDPLVQRNASYFGVTLVNFQKELMNDDWRRYESVFYVQGYMHPCGSRTTGNKDFNKLVSARFFAIEALMRKRNLEHVFCLENDMMVYTNFAETIEAVKNCGWRMASMFPHFKGVIPGLMYVRKSEDILKLSHFINDLLSCGKGFGKAVTKGYANDMTYMLNFYQLYGGQWMGDLPNSLNAFSGNQNCVADQLPYLLHDGASFGQWYSFALKNKPPIPALMDMVVPLQNGDRLPANAQCNQEQENDLAGNHAYFTKTSGCWSWEAKLANLVTNTESGVPISTAKPPLHVMNSMKNRFVDATPGELVKWKFDKQGRRVPYWGKYKLSSLHIHAKNLFWFRSK